MKQDELGRWRSFEAAFDTAFDAWEDGVQSPLPEPRDEGDASLRQQLAGFFASPVAESPIDQPLALRFDGLIDRALGTHARLGLGAGDAVGPYSIVEVIGEGGMGTVFLARRVDGSFEKEVALKVLHRSPADQGAHQRFRQERQILAGLRHPHIARLLDGGVVNEMPYLVMERIDGRPVTEFCEERRMGREARIRLFLQACDAVHHAHLRGIIHRDLKPSNLLVEEGADGEAKIAVLDFGIARIEDADIQFTSTGQVFGTPGYMSPEQTFGDRSAVDRRSDVFALGVILYELLSGQKPFAGNDANEILQRVLEGEPTPIRRLCPDLPSDLVGITEACLAREPARRYGSVRGLAEDLESYLEGGPVTVHPEGWAARLLRRARRRPRIAALTLGAGLLSLGSLLLLAWMAVRYTRDLEVERNAAIAARRDAEGLMAFMLEDLHEGLESVGRLDLLNQVAHQSLEYYRRRPLSSDGEAVWGRATALRNAGEILEEQGELDRALEAYGAGRKLVEGMLEINPSPRWRFELTRMHRALASALSAKGAAAEGLRHAVKALELSRRLGGEEPVPEGWAGLHYECLAMNGWLAREAGAMDEALLLLEEARAFAHEIAMTPEGTSEWRRRRALAQSYIGLVHSQEGALEEALRSFESARDQCAKLVEEDPENSSFREEFQLVLSHLGTTLLNLGDLERAAETMRQARRQAEVLVDLEPENAKWVRELAVSHSTLAAIHREAGKPSRALLSLKKSLEISRDLARRFPENHSATNDLAWDLLDFGRIEGELGRRRSAVRAWTEAVEVMQQLRARAPVSTYDLDTEVQALLELGRVEEALPLARQLYRDGWRAPDFLELCAYHGLSQEDLAAAGSKAGPPAEPEGVGGGGPD